MACLAQIVCAGIAGSSLHDLGMDARLKILEVTALSGDFQNFKNHFNQELLKGYFLSHGSGHQKFMQRLIEQAKLGASYNTKSQHYKIISLIEGKKSPSSQLGEKAEGTAQF